jgi:tubulin gamma
MAEPTYRRGSSVDEAQTPLLENMVVGVPPVFEGLTREIDQLGEQPLLGPKAEFPPRE